MTWNRTTWFLLVSKIPKCRLPENCVAEKMNVMINVAIMLSVIAQPGNNLDNKNGELHDFRFYYIYIALKSDFSIRSLHVCSVWKVNLITGNNRKTSHVLPGNFAHSSGYNCFFSFHIHVFILQRSEGVHWFITFIETFRSKLGFVVKGEYIYIYIYRRNCPESIAVHHTTC